jgi:hypothetical protein
MLPRHVQRVLLQACSCRVLAAGQVLLDTTSAAATGAAGAAAGCVALAAGAVLTVLPESDAGDGAAAAAEAQHTVLPRASLTPRGPGAAAAAAAAMKGRDADSYDPTPAMTPRTAAAAAAAGWQAVRAHVTSGSGAGSSAVDMGSHHQLPGNAVSKHGEAQRASPNAKAEQHTSSSSSSAAGSHKWDELSAAVVGPQRTRTAAFKALGWEVSSKAEQRVDLCCLVCNRPRRGRWFSIIQYVGSGFLAPWRTQKDDESWAVWNTSGPQCYYLSLNPW